MVVRHGLSRWVRVGGRIEYPAHFPRSPIRSRSSRGGWGSSIAQVCLARASAALRPRPGGLGWWRRLKDLYDPLGILNPHKIFPEQPADEHFLDSQPGWGKKLASGRDRAEVAT